MVEGSCGGHSLFLSFVVLSIYCSVLLPPYAHQLLGLGWRVLPSAPIRFFFVLSFLALLHADPAVVGSGVCIINNIYIIFVVLPPFYT